MQSGQKPGLNAGWISREKLTVTSHGYTERNFLFLCRESSYKRIRAGVEIVKPRPRRESRLHRSQPVPRVSQARESVKDTK